MSYLSLQGVVRHFAPGIGIPELDLAVDRGEAVCLLGPSGCGKTTLLRLIAGLLDPSAGSIHLDGRDITRLPAHRRDVGVVFQTWALFPHLTVQGNVEYGLRARGVPRAARQARVEEMLSLVGLSTLAGRRPHQLSGGQQQRVALARALAISPKLLLLDEPLSSLDTALRLDLRRELRRLQRQLGLTAIYVTHDHSEALAVADRTVLMQAGRIVASGPTQSLFARAPTVQAARFLGGTNLVQAKIERMEAGHATVRVAGVVASVPCLPGILQPGADAMLCFGEWSASAAPPGGAGLSITPVDTVQEHGTTLLIYRLQATGEPVRIRRPGLAALDADATCLTIDWPNAWLLPADPSP